MINYLKNYWLAFLLVFSYGCPTFFPVALPYPVPHSPHSHGPPPLLCVPMSPLFMFLDLTLPLLSPVIPLPSPLWSLSVCSLLFPCLWFYFAHLFVLLIRFHLKYYTCHYCTLLHIVTRYGREYCINAITMLLCFYIIRIFAYIPLYVIWSFHFGAT